MLGTHGWLAVLPCVRAWAGVGEWTGCVRAFVWVLTWEVVGCDSSDSWCVRACVQAGRGGMLAGRDVWGYVEREAREGERESLSCLC